MPDISAPIYIPSAQTSIADIDLNKVVNQSPILNNKENIDTGMNSAIPFSFDNKQYGQPLRVFDEKELEPVTGYNSFESFPTYNPELSSLQNIRGYAQQQGTTEWLANNFAKLGVTAKDSFINAFEQNGRNVQALTSWDANKLYSTEDNTIKQEQLKNLYPTYGTGELDNSFKRFLPWNFGKSDFGGEMLPQLGFTIGTVGETLLENWLVGIVGGVATGGAGTAYEIANTASKFGKIGEGFVRLFETANGITNFKKGLAVLNTIKNESSIGATIGQGAIKGAKLLANAYAMFNTAGGEAAFEANNAYTQQLQELEADFTERNGYAPFGKDLEAIKETANKTGTATFGWNIPVLLGSNLIQFGNILKPFKGVLAESVEDVGMELVGKGLKKSISTIAEKEVDSSLKKIFQKVGKALAEPISEGVEEYSQSIGSNFATEYYKDLYNSLSPNTALNNSLNAIWDYTGSKASQDDFFGGFLGGAVFKGVGKISEKTGLQEKLGFDTDKKIEDRKQALISQTTDILNSTSNEDLINYLFDPEVQNFISQTSNKQALINAAESNDRLKFNDLKSKSIRELIYTGLQTGKLELALSKLDIFKELDNEELSQALNIQDRNDIDKATTTASQIVDNIKERAYSLQSDWNDINRKYKNPYNPSSSIYKMYEEAKRDRLFSRDIVRDEQKRARDLRGDVMSSSDITDNIIDQAVDDDTLSKSINDLQVFVDEAPDRNNVEYRRKQTQLSLLQEIEKEKSKVKPDISKIAKLTFALGNINKSTLDIGRDEEFNTKRIEDVLKLEYRNKKNVSDYLLLNNKPIEQSVQGYVQAANTVIDKVKEKVSSSEIPANPEENNQDEIANIALTDENYNSWSNVRDKSDYAQFQDQINSAITQLKTIPRDKLTKEGINDYLKGIKAFSNEQIRNAVVNAFFPEKQNTLPIQEIPTTGDSEEQKVAEENINGSQKLASIKFATDRTPPSEQLSTSNPSDPQFHRRKDQFLENLHLNNIPIPGKKGKFWKKEDVKVLIVTPNNYTKYGKNLSSVLTNNFSLGQNTTSPFGVIAADYLFTGGIDTLLSTDYLIQALSGTFIKAGATIEGIRNKYAKEIGDNNLVDIKNFIGTNTYNKIISEIKKALNKEYNNKNAELLFEEILKYPTGLPFKLGNEISVKIDNLNTKSIDKFTQEEYKSLDNASVMFLFVVEDGKEIKPISIDGTLLSPLDGSSDYNIQDLIYTFNETSSPESYNSTRVKQGENVKTLSDQHRNQRLKWLSSQENQLSSFQISHGLPNMEKRDGKVIRIQNPVQDVNLIPTNHIFQPEDIYISTSREEFEKTNTNLVSDRYLRPGHSYLTIRDKSGSIVDYQKLENNLLTPNQKGSLLSAFKDLADNFFEQSTPLNETNNNYAFIKNLLFLQEKDVYKDVASIQIKQDVENKTFTILYDFSSQPKFFIFNEGLDTNSLLDNAEFKKWLDKRYLNIRKPSNKKFTEIYISNKTPKTRTWDNYTQYLLDNKNPSGETREISEIPLKAELYTPAQQESYYEGGNKYPTQRKQYYVKLGGRVVDDKGNTIKTNKTTTPTKATPPPSTGNVMEDLGKILATNQKAAEAKKNPSKTTQQPLDKGYTIGEKISLQSLLSSPAQQVQQIAEEKPEGNDVMAELAKIMAANQAKALNKGIALQNEQENQPIALSTVEEIPFIPDVSIEDIPENIISLRGKKPNRKNYTRGFTNLKNYDRENIQEIRDYFSKNLPQIQLETVNRLISIADGKLAWGTFSNGIVKIFEEAEAGTGYHEAFEAVFNGILNEKEQNNLLQEFSKRKGTFSNFATNGETKYSDASVEEAREEIAEEFLRYKLTGETKEDTRNIFQKILDFVLNFLKNLSSIEEVFQKLDRGYYANKELYNNGQTYNRLAGVGAVEEGYYLKGITYEMVSKLFNDTKSFTQFDEGFNERELYNNLYSQLKDFYNSDDEDNPNTYRNVLQDLYFPQIEAIESQPKFSEEYKAKLIKPLEIEFTKKLNAQRERFNTIISFQWKNLVNSHKTYLKQLGVINFVEKDDEQEDNQDEKNSNEYVKNDFKIDIKNTAPRSIKLLFNTIAESTFNFEETQELSNGLSIPLIEPKIVNETGLVNLYDSGAELFNIVLSQVSEINTLDGIKNKIEKILGIEEISNLQNSPEKLTEYIQSRLDEEQYKNNSIYTHLFKIYTRVFATPENELSQAEWKQRLKFLSTFSKQKPEVYTLVSGEDGTYLRDQIRDSGRRQIISRWFSKLNDNIYNKNIVSVLSKKGRKNPFSSNQSAIAGLLNISDRNAFILNTAKAIGIEEINAAFLENLTGEEQNNLSKNLRTILIEGFSKLFNGKDGRKLFNKLSGNNLTVSTPYNDVADIILSKKGDEVDPVRSNIEGEQQQNIILNNEISNRLASFNRYSTLQSYIDENPEFNDTYVKSSLLLQKIFNRNGARTSFSPKVAVIEGTQESSRENGKKSSNQNLTERLYQEFNINLEGKYYILLPADSETEWAISLGKERYIDFKDNNIDANLDVFLNYLKSEIEVAQQFINKESEFYTNRNADEYLSQLRPLKDGSERKVGASLQMFKDVLSDDLVSSIHSHIDDLSYSPEQIIEEYSAVIRKDLRDWINLRVDETFKNLNTSEIVERKDRKAGEFEEKIINNSQYIFYGLNSTFNRDVTKYSNNQREVKRGQNSSIESIPNEYLLTSSQLKNLIAYREMSFMINNVEMTKLFIGNPYFYKDIQKRVKSFLSTTENSYVQNFSDVHKAEDWMNSSLNSVTLQNKNKEETYKLPSDHIHRHVFSPSIKTWVFRDHFTLNKELSKFNSKYSANNSTDAQSFIIPNSYREFYWKSGAKFRETQERQFQIEQAFERFLLDEDNLYAYTDSKLKALDQKILEGQIKKTKNGWELLSKYDVFEVFKPKGSGTLGGLNTFDPYIWKTSVAFMNYRMVRNTPMQIAYLKMLNEGVHVLTFESAIKVGLKKDLLTNKVNSLIDVDSFQDLGKISPSLSSYTHQLPFKSVGLQVETGTQKNKGTIGTQTTKLILTDLFEYGIPTDFDKENFDFGEKMSKWYSLSEEEKLVQSKHYSLEKEHQKAIENLENIGYYDLLDRLGIKEVDRNGRKEYEYDSLDKVYQLLKEEMIKRGLSSNIYDMFDDVSLKVKPIEALSNYAQASFIIMSVVRKSIIKPKLNGGQKIQASSVLLNQLQNEGLTASYFDKKTNIWKDISSEEEFNKLKKNGNKIMYNSPQLKFYSKNENGELNVMEVMLPNVFRDKLNKYRKAKNLGELSDEELLNYLNKYEPKLLEGIGFRIPTQALSSIDTFKIKGFLPSYFGDTVIVPSELTTKVGSDFDVDKLNTYLNNWTISSKGYPKYQEADLENSEQATNRRWKKYSSSKRLLSLIDGSINELTQKGIIQDRNAEAFTSAIAEQIDHDEKIEDILQQIDEEGNSEIIKRVIEANELSLFDLDKLRIKVENLKSEEEFKSLPTALQNSKGSIENNYFSIIDQILKLPQNFEKMLAPNNSDEFVKEGALRDKIVESLVNSNSLNKIPKEKRSKYINYSNILDSNKMRYNRWAFVIGKKGVGIGALSATNHVNSQKIGFQLNPSTKSKNSWWNNKIYGKNGVDSSLIKFKHNELSINGEKISVLSGITKREGENIAEFVSKYVNGYVDVSKDAWILDIGAQMEIAGIYLLMERLGINSEEIIYFLNQPSIKYYLNLSALKNSPIRNINPRVKEQVSSLNTDEKIYQQVKKLIVGDQIVKSVTEFKLKDLKNTIEKYSKTPLIQWQKNGNISVREKENQFLIFRQFLQLKDYSNYIRASQTASNHDTANLNSLHILDDKDDTLNNLNSPYADQLITSIAEGIPMAQALRDKTFVGNLSNKLSTIDEQFLSKDLFRIQSKAVRKSLRDVMMKLNPSIFGESDRREMMDKITKVAINSLVLNTELNNRGELINNLDTVMKTEYLRNTVNKVRDILKNPDATYKEQLKNANIDLAHIISNKWINQLSVEPIDIDSEFGYLSIAGKKAADNFEKQVWIEDFRKLKELPFTQNLYKAILAASIYQAGAEYNRSSLLDLIPWQDYAPIINNGLDNLSILSENNIGRMIAQLKAFDKSYFTPLEYISGGTINNKKYYAKSISLLGKENNSVEVGKISNLYQPSSTFSPWIGSYEHISATGERVKEISSVILVPFTPYYDKLSYFTLKQKDSSYTAENIKEMMNAKNFSFYTTILLEKAPILYDNGLETYFVFRPINTKGNRYLQETTFNNEYSKLDTHEKVNPSLTNDDILFNLLSSKYPGNIKKTEYFQEAPVLPVVDEKSAPTQEENVTEDIPFEEVPNENKELPNSTSLLENATDPSVELEENDVTSEENYNMNIVPLNSNFDRKSVEQDKDYIYLFTDNAKRTSGSNPIKKDGMYGTIYGNNARYPTMTQAVIRGLDNAYPITTMVDDKRTQWTDSKFNEYKKIIDLEVDHILGDLQSGEFKGVKFSAQMPFGKGKISNMKESAPRIWNYLNKKLSEIGIDNTGEKPKILVGTFSPSEETQTLLFSPDDLPSISSENTIEGTCE